MPSKKDAVLDALKKATKGLRFESETDAPLTPFAWPGADGELSQDRVRELAGAGKGTAIDVTTLEAFFRTVPTEDRAKFQALTKVMKDQLSGIQVYKVGDEAERQVYVVGKTTDGRWAGVKTTVVET